MTGGEEMERRKRWEDGVVGSRVSGKKPPYYTIATYLQTFTVGLCSKVQEAIHCS